MGCGYVNIDSVGDVVDDWNLDEIVQVSIFEDIVEWLCIRISVCQDWSVLNEWVVILDSWEDLVMICEDFLGMIGVQGFEVNFGIIQCVDCIFIIGEEGVVVCILDQVEFVLVRVVVVVWIIWLGCIDIGIWIIWLIFSWIVEEVRFVVEVECDDVEVCVQVSIQNRVEEDLQWIQELVIESEVCVELVDFIGGWVDFDVMCIWCYCWVFFMVNFVMVVVFEVEVDEIMVVVYIVGDVEVMFFIIVYFWVGVEGVDFQVVEFCMYDGVDNISNSVRIVYGGSIVGQDVEMFNYICWDQVQVRMGWCVMYISWFNVVAVQQDQGMFSVQIMKRNGRSIWIGVSYLIGKGVVELCIRSNGSVLYDGSSIDDISVMCGVGVDDLQWRWVGESVMSNMRISNDDVVSNFVFFFFLCVWYLFYVLCEYRLSVYGQSSNVSKYCRVQQMFFISENCYDFIFFDFFKC